MPMLRRTCLAFLIALPLVASAQGTGRTYQVEVIVFEQSGNTAEVLVFPEPVGEDLPAEADAPATPAGSGLAPGPGNGPAPVPGEGPLNGEAEPALPEGFAGPLDEPGMKAILDRLKAGRYRVLWHQAWTQRAFDRGEEGATPLPVLAAFGGGPADEALEGSVELSAGHYLHLGLKLTRPAAEATGTYTLSQRRRVKINELHYFDHPRLGAVTLVTVPAAQPLSAEPPGAAP